MILEHEIDILTYVWQSSFISDETDETAFLLFLNDSTSWMQLICINVKAVRWESFLMVEQTIAVKTSQKNWGSIYLNCSCILSQRYIHRSRCSVAPVPTTKLSYLSFSLYKSWQVLSLKYVFYNDNVQFIWIMIRKFHECYSNC